jgi:P27 family predicted phage terminase small subunit
MGRRPQNLASRNEPIAPPVAVPDPPAIITADAAAAAEWHRVTALLLAEGSITKIDLAVIARYCIAYSRWQHATAQLAETGGEIVANARQEPIQNPWLAVARAAARELGQAAEPIGLSPAARTKVKRSGAASPTVAALDDFLNA